MVYEIPVMCFLIRNTLYIFTLLDLGIGQCFQGQEADDIKYITQSQRHHLKFLLLKGTRWSGSSFVITLNHINYFSNCTALLLFFSSTRLNIFLQLEFQYNYNKSKQTYNWLKNIILCYYLLLGICVACSLFLPFC